MLLLCAKLGVKTGSHTIVYFQIEFLGVNYIFIQWHIIEVKQHVFAFIFGQGNPFIQLRNHIQSPVVNTQWIFRLCLIFLLIVGVGAVILLL